MITREEALQTIHDCRITSLGELAHGYTVYQATANILINQLFDQQDQLQQHIKELEEDLMSQGQIAQRALLIGYEEGWFEWKGDAENGGNFSSIETDLKKIRDNTKIYGYIKMMNAHSDALKNKIADLESQLSSNPEQLTCEWNMDEPDWNTYKTGCDKYFNLVEGNLKDNYFSNCPYCGGKITLKDTK